jgi:multisubunit Na+/H+ antiporter MnhB subunit
VVIGVTSVVLFQLAFTCLPFMQTLFATRPVAFLDGLAVLGIGIALLVILEIGKLARRRLGFEPETARVEAGADACSAGR